jgi:FkbM family methyltransferase
MKTNFRPGLNDECIFHTASELNEYLLPDSIEPDDIIIDIGAHIGGFIYGCLKRGARNIYAYESLKENYDLALACFDEEIIYGTVKLYNLAVWRSDISNPITLYNSGFCQPDNSGTNVVVYNTTKDMPVNTISLDDIIDNVGKSRKIKLVKLDCEGSEFPILFTSKKLNQIDYICGEYHSIPLCNFEKDGKSKFSEHDLYLFLKSQGFSMIYFKNPLNDLIGMFYAKKNSLIDTFFKNIIIP